MDIRDNLSRIMRLFAGNEGARGTYKPSTTPGLNAGKVEIKTTARTLREPITEDHWRSHLGGQEPLGVVPICDDGTCVWGCIDIDRYDINHGLIADRIQQMKLPLVVAKSKSGGAHLFLFLREPTQALVVRTYLHDCAAKLGFGGSEIFPKQSEIKAERGDIGNWMIMPYFGETMYGVRPGGGEFTLEEFIMYAERWRIDPARLGDTLEPENTGDHSISDGPPCLQHLCRAGFPEGTRNEGLFALGVYCRKRWPEDWQSHLEQMNRDSMRPPLPSDEVLDVIKQLKRKDYQYKCRNIPLVNHCNSPVCRSRAHGVGDQDPLPEISGLSVLSTNPPLWFMDLGTDRLELTTDELREFFRFHRVVMERLHKCLPMVKTETWMRKISKAMESVVVIETPPEVGSSGLVGEGIEEFLTNRRKGNRKEDILTGRPWEDEITQRHYFRLRDLTEWLERRPETRTFPRNKLTTLLRELGGGFNVINMKGHSVRVWYLPTSVVVMAPIPDPPSMKEDAI